jgi:integrase/recombinase XerD
MSKTLRTQFINYMVLHRFSPSTIKHYMGTMRRLANYYNKSPDLITNEQIQDYVFYLINDRKLAWSSCNTEIAGMSCFYKNVLKWDKNKLKLPPKQRIKKLPNILSVEEVKRLFECTTNLKHRVLLKTVYSAGLRISEVVKLKPIHIESDPSRMMIRIEQSKGKKDRYTVLSKHLLSELRIYWLKYKPNKWIFPGYNQDNHIGYASARDAFTKAKKKPEYKEGGVSILLGIVLQAIFFPKGQTFSLLKNTLGILQ